MNVNSKLDRLKEEIDQQMPLFDEDEQPRSLDEIPCVARDVAHHVSLQSALVVT